MIFFSNCDEQNTFMLKEADLLVENKHLILTTDLKFYGCETSSGIRLLRSHPVLPQDFQHVVDSGTYQNNPISA